MRHSSQFFTILAASLCSLSLSAAESNAPTPPTYADVAPIIADNCQFCHTGGADAVAGISLDTEAEVVAQAKLIYAAVSTGLMPYGDETWHLTADGQKLLDYAQSQIPVTK